MASKLFKERPARQDRIAAYASERVFDGARPLSAERLAKAKASYLRNFPAKPVQGETDFASIRDSIISRFPKTLAYLAGLEVGMSL